MGLPWGEAQLAAKDRDRWRNIITAICLIGGKELKKNPNNLLLLAPFFRKGVLKHDMHKTLCDVTRSWSLPEANINNNEVQPSETW